MTDQDSLEIQKNVSIGKKIKVINVESIKDFLFLNLENGQKILVNKDCAYDVSAYSYVINTFSLGDRMCATLAKGYTKYVVDLKTMEILFEDDDAYLVSKEDDRTLRVIMNNSEMPTRIYDIEEKRYLSAPLGYEFEHSLGQGLYVYKEQRDFEIPFFKSKRCVINLEGQVLLSQVEGWIDFRDNHLIITKDDELNIVGIDYKRKLDMQVLEENETAIAKPQYSDGNIIMVYNNSVKTYDVNMNLIKEIGVEALHKVLDIEVINGVLKLLLPHDINDKKVNRHVFVNLQNDKVISHVRIEGYPYWTPTVFIGRDSIDEGFSEYYFYDKDFNFITKIGADTCEVIENDDKCFALLTTKSSSDIKKQFVNILDGAIKESPYDYIYFNSLSPYGYGVNFDSGTLDFIDENLNVVIPKFQYKNNKLSLGAGGFSYCIINDYVCIKSHLVNDFGQSVFRTIIQKSTGEEVIDSIRCNYSVVGYYIQIIQNGKSEFLNTLTGEISALQLIVQTDERGRIDVSNCILESTANKMLLGQSDNNSEVKIKKRSKE